MKTALLRQILAIVAEICEINGNEICSHVKKANVVDARCIFVYYCSKYGFPSADIAEFIGRKRICSIRDLISNHRYFSKSSAAFRYLSAEVGKKLAGIVPEE